jgi:hypothetical protein
MKSCANRFALLIWTLVVAGAIRCTANVSQLRVIKAEAYFLFTNSITSVCPSSSELMLGSISRCTARRWYRKVPGLLLL